MQRKTFHYHIPAEEWRECRDEKMSAKDIEQIPVHFILCRPVRIGDDCKAVIWCPAHSTYEEVSTFEEYSLTSAAGCKFDGLFAHVNEAPDRHTPVQDVPIRSRLLYNEATGIVTIFADMATVYFQSIKDRECGEITYIPRSRQYKVESLSVILRDKKITPQDKLKKIPLATAKAALPFLKAEAERISGCSIKLPGSVDRNVFPTGEAILSAFLYQPGDMNLWLLKEYFRNGQYSFWMSPDDNFLDLCHVFHLEPEKYLEFLYDCNPLALPILYVLHMLGITKRELAEPFLKSDTFLGDSVADGLKKVRGYGNPNTAFPANFFDNEENIRNFLSNRAGASDTWNPLLFYCQYRLRYEKEEDLAEHLLKMNSAWEPRLWRSLRLFFHHYPQLPESIREKVMQEGLTLDLHNEIVRIINQKKLAWPEFTYSEKELAYECEIGGYAFRLIRNSEQYHSVMQNMGFYCTKTLIELPDSGIMRMAIYKGEKPVAYFELHGIALMMQKSNGSSYDNCLRNASVRVSFLHWLKWTGLLENYGPYYEEDYEILQEDVTVSPVAKDVGMSLYELLNMQETPADYYRRLYHVLMTASPLCYEVTPPCIYDETSEMAYLMSLFPYGKRIYEAAFAGDSEAQYVLSLCYSDGGKYHTLFPLNKERSEYWKRRSYTNRRR